MQKAVELLQREPWQAWPCRGELVKKESAQGGAGARVRVRVSLLAPDHSVAGQHTVRFSADAWRAMTDGYGVLYFAGDLRFASVIAEPRSTSVYLTEPVEEAQPQQTGNSVVEEELTRQAIGWLFSQ